MTVHKNSLKNLEKSKGFAENTTQKQRNIARKGGIASGIAKRKRKTLAEYAEIYGNLPIDEKTKDTLSKQGVDADNMTHDMALIYGQYASALRGNSNSARFLAELMGELKQAQTTVTVNNINPFANLTEDELRKLAKGE